MRSALGQEETYTGRKHSITRAERNMPVAFRVYPHWDHRELALRPIGHMSKYSGGIRQALVWRA